MLFVEHSRETDIPISSPAAIRNWICADNYKELLEKGRDSNGEEVFGEMLDDLLYLAELIDFMGITSCLAARGTLSERLTDKLTDSIAGLADEVLEKWENYQDKAE